MKRDCIERHLDGIGDRPGELTPALRDLRAGDLSLRPGDELDDDLHEVRASRRRQRVVGTLSADLLSDGREDVGHDALLRIALAIELCPQRLDRALELIHGRFCVLERGPLGQRHGGVDPVTLDAGEELEGDAAADEECRGEDQDPDGPRESQVAPLEHALESRLVAPSYEPLEAPGHVILNTRPAAPPRVVGSAEPVRQVRGQDELGLHQREQQADHHRAPQHREELHHPALDQNQRREGRNRSEHAEDDRHGDVEGPPHGRFSTLHTRLPVGVDALPDHDRIVDDDPEHQQEPHDGERADREAQGRKQREGPEQRDGNSCCNPERHAEAQDQGEHRQDEQQAPRGIPPERPDPSPQPLRLVVPDRELDALGDPCTRPLHVGLDRVRQPQEVLVPDSRDLDDDCGLSVEVRPEIVVPEPVDHPSDLAQPHRRPVSAGNHDDRFKLRAVVGLTLRSEQDFAALGLERSARKIDRGVAHGRRELVEGDPVAAEGLLRDLYGDLEGANVVELHLRHPGERGDLVAHLLAQHLERSLARRSRDRDVHHVLPEREQRDHGLLGLGRKAANRVHLALELRERPVRVGPELELQPDRADSLGGKRGHAIDPGRTLDRLLDPDADPLLDLLGRRAQVGDADHDRFKLDVRELLLTDRQQREDAAGDEHGHEQIGSNGVVDEPGDDGLHAWGARGVSETRTGLTRMPSTGAWIGEMQMRSPCSRPRRMSASSPSIRRTSTSRKRSRSSASTTNTRFFACRAWRGIIATSSAARPAIRACTNRPTGRGRSPWPSFATWATTWTRRLLGSISPSVRTTRPCHVCASPAKRAESTTSGSLSSGIEPRRQIGSSR